MTFAVVPGARGCRYNNMNRELLSGGLRVPVSGIAPSPAATRLWVFVPSHCIPIRGFRWIRGLAPYTLIHPIYQLNQGINFLNLIKKRSPPGSLFTLPDDKDYSMILSGQIVKIQAQPLRGSGFFIRLMSLKQVWLNAEQGLFHDPFWSNRQDPSPAATRLWVFLFRRIVYQ